MRKIKRKIPEQNMDEIQYHKVKFNVGHVKCGEYSSVICCLVCGVGAVLNYELE